MLTSEKRFQSFMKIIVPQAFKVQSSLTQTFCFIVGDILNIYEHISHHLSYHCNEFEHFENL